MRGQVADCDVNFAEIWGAHMHYKIEEVEGIGPSYGKKLAAAGIVTTGTLLKTCGSAKGRKQIAAQCGVSESLLLKWTNLADLMRVSGVGKQFSELLEAAGVDTVKELRNRRPDNLAAKMKEVNAKKRLTRATPSVAKVTTWVTQAKALKPAVSH
jgi:predicted flap endonuclease-1-like 5' DNA nuclease